MSYGFPRIGAALIAMLVAAGPVSADDTSTTRPAAADPAQSSWDRLFAAAVEDSPATRPAVPGPPATAWPKLFSELASADLETREAARVALMRLSRDNLPALKTMVAKSLPMLPAQAAALREIVQEIFLAGEPYDTQFTVQGTDRITGEVTKVAVEASSAARAAEIAAPKIKVRKASDIKVTQGFLGILMDELARSDVGAENDGDHPIGVIVADRIPGFCASRYLHDGDIILGIASPFTPFRSRMDLTSAVGGLPPGTNVQLLVLRRGQVIGVMLTLDPRPTPQLLDDSGLMFRNDRQRKFDAYWQANFKSLLSQQLG